MSGAPKPPAPKKFLGVKIRKATVAEADVPLPEEAALTIAPSSAPVIAADVDVDVQAKQESSQPVTSVTRKFFGKSKAAVPVHVPVPVLSGISATATATAPVVPVVPVPVPVAETTTEALAPPAETEESVDLAFVGTDLEAYAASIKDEETRSPYTVTAPPTGYVPQTRRGFSNFIRETYAQFTLPPLPGEPDYDACMKLGAQGAIKAQIYQYQQFVRDYMSWSTPYRGVLVYHGLGSGKTCTAIAAAEALFATSNRKIIVMTPKSLRKNFIREITFCGFRHFRLMNHWVKFPNDPIGNPLVRLFASKVLNIPLSHLKKAKNIWVPDFSQPQNYNPPSNATPEQKATYLNATEQTEVREQIQAIIVFEPNPNPRLQKDGRIWFINYNGITPSKLKEIACAKPNTAFDNAVIVVDEIHNLIRLMQGTIEPYLSELKGVKRKIAPEPVTSDKWAPRLCGKSMNYKRGYLFYRLLVGAQNSKIIGLSGTPLINFPEELGILSNVLYGYLHIAEGLVAKRGTSDEDMKVKETIERTATSNLYIDYYRVTITDTAIRVSVTALPDGIRKIKGDIGVERIPSDEPTLNLNERLESFKAELIEAGITLNSAFKIRSEPLLPPAGDQFRENFIAADGVAIKNRNVLLKRLTGLVSYYKGSRKDLMPAVTRDEVVRVPFSLYQQDQYSRVRVEEIDIEKKKEKEKPVQGGIGTGKLGALWAEVYDIKNMRQSSNYRMGSRQACNFVFPAGIGRPRPISQAEALIETGPDPVDILDEAPHDTATTDEPDDVASVLEEEDAERQAAEQEEALVDQEAEVAYLAEQKAQMLALGKSEAEVAEALTTIMKEYRDTGAAELIKGEEQGPTDVEPTEEEKLCRAVRLRGETYPQATTRAKKCLATIGKNKILLSNDEGLVTLSPKFATMIQKINEAKGSSLVYSQFLQMEGIGIFTLVLQANEFDPIVIETGAGGARFSDATIESLKKGPDANQPRFITFTGGEDEEVRRYAVDIFNAKFSELPKTMSDVLAENGYTSNQKGELCRVFCITSAGAEGLSLKNVRAVHIMEPYWNDVRMAQVKGRAVRICSHMDIQPPSERTVEIFTYVTVFGPEAQMARQGAFRITEDIMLRDSLTPEEAKIAKLPIPEGAAAYVLTSDERLLVVSNRKKALIGNLERVMKSAAVDCQINYNENQDGTFTCALFGKTGGFLYNPDLLMDIAETTELFGEGTATTTQTQTTQTQTTQTQTQTSVKTRKLLPAKVGDKTLYLEKGVDPATKAPVFFIYPSTTSTQPIGQTDVDAVTGAPKKGTAKMYKK